MPLVCDKLSRTRKRQENDFCGPTARMKKLPLSLHTKLVRAGARTQGVRGPRCPAVNRLRRFPAGEEALEQKKQVFRPRGSAPQGCGGCQRGKGHSEVKEKLVFSFTEEPLYPPLVLFLCEHFFLERKKCGKTTVILQRSKMCLKNETIAF